MPDLKEVLGDYYRVLPTLPELNEQQQDWQRLCNKDVPTLSELDPRRQVFQKFYDNLMPELDPQREVWQKFYAELNRKLSDLGKLRMYHADRARHTRTRVD